MSHGEHRGHRGTFALGSLCSLCSLWLLLGGCKYVRRYEPPPQPEYAPVWEAKLSLAEKAARYERWLRERHRTPEGIVDYRVPKAGRPPGEPRYGRHADGPFFTGIALGAFSLKYAATREPPALACAAKALEGLELLERVTGRPGLLARYASRDPPPFDPRAMDPEHGYRAAPPLGDYVFRADVSKDQYAGVLFGLGACLAHVDDAGLRARASALARRVAAMLEASGESIVDVTGEETRFGDLDAFYGPVRVALHAAICLGFARAAAEDGGGDAYYRDLLARGWGDAVAGGIMNASVFGVRNHVNDNMAFLVLYPLILLERDAPVRGRYLRALEREWAEVGDELNPFFDLAYAACGGREGGRAAREGAASLRLFPDEKRALPVDWTRPGAAGRDLGRRCLNTRKGRPRAARPLPLNMRPVGSMLWVSDPDALVGNEGRRDDVWIVGLDYLEAYWLGRAHGLIGAGE